ncbi:MAG: flagellar hook-length control protein FliK [Deltaproteobacteria bacterium]|nr:flagellar hook-length control protein FliK [Deltaproteobacteria bacterium]
MNNLDQILGLGSSNPPLSKSESVRSTAEDQPDSFEGVLNSQCDEQKSVAKTNVAKTNNEGKKSDSVNASAKDKKQTEESESAVSSSAQKDTKAQGNKTQEKKEEDKSGDQKSDKVEAVNPKEVQKAEAQGASALQPDPGYLALFVQELLQSKTQMAPLDTKTPVLPGEKTASEKTDVKTQTGQPTAQIEAEKLAPTLAPVLPLQTAADLSAQKMSAPSPFSQALKDSQKTKSAVEEEVLAKLQLQLGQVKAPALAALEKAKEVSSHLLQEIKPQQNQKVAAAVLEKKAAALAELSQVNPLDKANPALKEMLAKLEDSTLSEDNFSVDLSKAAQNLNLDVDKITLSQSLAQTPAKETLAGPAALGGPVASDALAKNQAPILFKPEDISSIHRQLVDSFQVTVKAKEGRAELQLTPPDWGRINIQMNVENKNDLKVHLIVENPNVRQLLEQNSVELKQAMASSGLGFANINVGVGSESSSTWKNREEGSVSDPSFKILKKQVSAPTAYRWINSQASGVDQIV